MWPFPGICWDKMTALVIIFAATMLGMSTHWINRKFGDITYEQILFHMNISLDSETRLLKSFLENTLMVSVILLAVLYILFGLKQYRWAVWEKLAVWVRRHALKLSLVYLAAVLGFVAYRIDFAEIVEDYHARNVFSSFYEENWSDPQKAEILFPRHKRNLVMIFAESFEATYLNEKNREFFKDDFMPEMRRLAEENINFSGDDDIGGMIAVDGTQWTQAGLVSQTCGIPLHLPIVKHNKFLPKHGYLPEAYCLSDVLADAGYNQVFMTGMEGSYAGVDRFWKTHGNVKVLSWEYFKPKYNLQDDADPVRRRILRDKMFLEDAKEQLQQLAQKKQPFALTLMTMDTHGGWEYADGENCGHEYAEHYKNVYKCSDAKVADFVRWIQKQDFYKNTTVVVVGDHLVMNDDIFDNGEHLQRRILNIFINADKPLIRSKFRQFSSFDIYPTIVEALGAHIRGRKLGLGVSLFAALPTLLERDYTPDILEDEMSKRSRIYDYLLFGK